MKVEIFKPLGFLFSIQLIENVIWQNIVEH